MARQTPFKPEAKRSVAIAATMAGVLILSMGMALALSTYRQDSWSISQGQAGFTLTPTRIADLEFPIPKDWTLLPLINPLPQIDSPAAFASPQDTQHHLMVAGIRSSLPRAPIVALNNMINAVLPEPIRRNMKQVQATVRLHTGHITGLMYTGFIQNADTVQLHQIAVITQDGRRYWLVYLKEQLLDPSQAQESITFNNKLMASMMAGIVAHHLRDAQPADFLAAGLGPWEQPIVLPSGLRAHVSVTGHAGQPVLLLPTQAQSQLLAIVVRGTPDTGVTDRSDPLSPDHLLAQQFHDTMGRSPRPGEIWTGRVASYPAWCATFSQLNATLNRHLWYIRVGAGPSLLVQVYTMRSGPSIRYQALQWIAPLVSSLTSQPARLPPPAVSIENATTLGVELAQQQASDQLPRLRFARQTYYLINIDGQTIGGHITKSGPSTDDTGYLQGFNKTLILHGRPITLNQHWQWSVDGAWYQSKTHRITGLGDTQTTDPLVEYLTLANKQLSFSKRSASAESDQWTVDVPQAFIVPVLEDYWSVLLDSSQPSTPALVWISHAPRPPKPYWIELANPDSTHQNQSAPGSATVLMRPLMSLEADQLTLDANGAVLRYQSRRAGSSYRGATIDVYQVTRDQLVSALTRITPDTATDLSDWLNEEQDLIQ